MDSDRRKRVGERMESLPKSVVIPPAMPRSILVAAFATGGVVGGGCDLSPSSGILTALPIPSQKIAKAAKGERSPRN
jgi:hypothetical protein